MKRRSNKKHKSGKLMLNSKKKSYWKSRETSIDRKSIKLCLLTLNLRETIRLETEREDMLFVRIWFWNCWISLNRCMSVVRKEIKNKSILQNLKLHWSNLWEERKLLRKRHQSGWNIMLMEVMNGDFQSQDLRKKCQQIPKKTMLFQTSQLTITILEKFSF